MLECWIQPGSSEAERACAQKGLRVQAHAARMADQSDSLNGRMIMPRAAARPLLHPRDCPSLSAALAGAFLFCLPLLQRPVLPRHHIGTLICSTPFDALP